MSALAAPDFLQDAVNDHSGRYHQVYLTSDLYAAIEQWTDRPELPARSIRATQVTAS
jgi:hypothetical protein